MEEQTNKNLPEKQPNSEATSQKSSLKAYQQEDENGKKVGMELSVSSYKSNDGLPPIEFIKSYGEVLPDAPNRILTMAENEANRRYELRKMAFEEQKQENVRNHSLTKLGLWLGATIAIVIIIGSIIAICLGHYIGGSSVLLGPTTVGLIYAFIKRNSNKDKTTEQK